MSSSHRLSYLELRSFIDNELAGSEVPAEVGMFVEDS